MATLGSKESNGSPTDQLSPVVPALQLSNCLIRHINTGHKTLGSRGVLLWPSSYSEHDGRLF
jgi:hypothetical protein